MATTRKTTNATPEGVSPLAPLVPKEARDQVFELMLKVCRQQFDGGNRFALFDAVIFSAAARRPVPEWVREQLQAIDIGLRSGEVANLNGAFGWAGLGNTHQSTRRSGARHRRYFHEIALELWKRRRNGEPADIETFDAIATDLRERHGLRDGTLGRPAVERVWREFGRSIDASVDGPPPADHFRRLYDYWNW